MRYRNKIRVFISSACNSEPFDSIRKELKQKIDNTNFAQAYLYEEDPASSLPNQNVYLYELDDCHVCIFLIDTSVDLPLGVQAEVARTKAKNIKSLFVFRRSEPEPKIELQKELEQSGNLKYYEVNSLNNRYFLILTKQYFHRSCKTLLNYEELLDDEHKNRL